MTYLFKKYFNKYSLRAYRYRVMTYLPLPRLNPSKEDVDIVIPLTDKDLDTFPLCLAGLRHNVAHPIRRIYVVAPPREVVKNFCKENNLEYVDETTVLGVSPKDINLIVKRQDGKILNRSGWLFQQLLKLSGNVGTCENYITIDSDHVLLRPHCFITEEQVPVFYQSAEFNDPYYDNIARVSSLRKFSSLSYVAHKMVFNKSQLESLRKDIEDVTGHNWIDGIIANYDRTQLSGFSEFELYGNFVRRQERRPWRQIECPLDHTLTYEKIAAQYAPKWWSITFPSYLR